MNVNIGYVDPDGGDYRHVYDMGDGYYRWRSASTLRWIEAKELPSTFETYEQRRLDAEPEVPAPASDPVNAPEYYIFGDVQLIQITRHLNSNGGQAVQYIGRSTRTDGKNKGEQVQDLKKALVFINDEIERLESR